MENTEQIDDVFKKLRDELEGGKIFKDDSERKGFYHKHFSMTRKAWNTAGICLYPGCLKNTIKNSHTIQRNGPLKKVAENDKVLTPEFNGGKINMRSKGIASSSIFPGFCSDHEEIFKIFENNIKLETEEDMRLQIFRTISRHLHMVNFQYKHTDDFIKSLNEKKSDKAREIMLENKLFRQSIVEEVIEVRTEDNIIEEKIISELKQFIENAEKLHNASGLDVLMQKDEEVYINALMSSSLDIPVCLAEVGNLPIIKDNEEANIPVVMNVLPQPNGTLIMAAVSKDYKDELDNYLRPFQVNGLGILNLIESWMVYGTDHWFIKPSVWKKMSKKKQSRIFEELLKLDKSTQNECPFSILDKEREKFLGQMQSEINNERKKIKKV